MALRSDDLQGMSTKNFIMRGHRLEAQIERAKVSGPARKIGWLPAFIGPGAYFVDPSWVTQWLAMLHRDGFFTDRDCLVPFALLPYCQMNE